MKRIALALGIVALVAACGDKGGVAPNKNNANNTTGSNNSTSGSNNSTSGSNNATSNNGTTSTNGTSGPNNTTGPCTELDPALGDCDPICQTGCDIAEHCLIDADAMAACAPSGIGAQDDPCNADTECAVGLHCRSVGGGDRHCLSYCNPMGEPGCLAGHACVRLQADVRVGACVPIDNTCDAVPTDSCTDPDECYDTITGRQCLPSGSIAADQECQLSSDCGPGLRCVSIMDIGQVCKPLCDPNGAADQCADGMCRTLSSPAGAPLTWGACY